MREVAEGLDGYIQTALWSNTDDGEPLDSKYGPADIAPEALAKMELELNDFVNKAETILHAYMDDDRQGQEARRLLEHNFWLTRNHHGVGFWDGYPYTEDCGRQLTELAHSFGEQYLYVGDDGVLYVS
jgi:hypothetical protein